MACTVVTSRFHLQTLHSGVCNEFALAWGKKHEDAHHTDKVEELKTLEVEGGNYYFLLYVCLLHYFICNKHAIPTYIHNTHIYWKGREVNPYLRETLKDSIILEIMAEILGNITQGYMISEGK